MTALKLCRDCKWAVTTSGLFQSQYPPNAQLRCSHDRVNRQNENFLASGDEVDMKSANIARLRINGWFFDTCGHRGKLWEPKA